MRRRRGEVRPPAAASQASTSSADTGNRTRPPALPLAYSPACSTDQPARTLLAYLASSRRTPSLSPSPTPHHHGQLAHRAPRVDQRPPPAQLHKGTHSSLCQPHRLLPSSRRGDDVAVRLARFADPPPLPSSSACSAGRAMRCVHLSLYPGAASRRPRGLPRLRRALLADLLLLLSPSSPSSPATSALALRRFVHVLLDDFIPRRAPRPARPPALRPRLVLLRSPRLASVDMRSHDIQEREASTARSSTRSLVTSP